MNTVKLDHVTMPQDIQREHVRDIFVGRDMRGAKVTLHDGRVFDVSNATKARLFDADYFTRTNVGNNPADGHKLTPPAFTDWEEIMEQQESIAGANRADCGVM